MTITDPTGFDLTQGFAPADIVAAPPFLPRQFGLFSVANMPDEEQPHVRNGVRSIPNPHSPSKLYVDYCTRGPGEGQIELGSPDDRAKVIEPGVPVIGAQPFTVFDGFNCSPVGFGQSEIGDRAKASLTEGEERAVERAVITGASDNGETVHPNFTDDLDDTFGTYDSAAEAVGAAEEYIDRAYGGLATLLVPRAVIAALVQSGTVTRQGNVLVTTLGSKLAAVAVGDFGDDSPYTLYASGSIVVRRGGIEEIGDFASSLDRATNGLVRLMERTYSALIDGPMASFSFTLGGAV